MNSRSSTTETPAGARPLPERVEVATVRRPHGVRGAVLVEVASDNPDRFAAGTELFAGDGAAARRLRIAGTRGSGSALRISFEGVETREEAELLRGLKLEVERSAVPPAPEGTYYYYELMGCRCRDRELGELGEVVDVVEDGGGLLLVVRGERGEVPIPFVRAFLSRVDIAGGSIELNLPQGLIETCTSAS